MRSDHNFVAKFLIEEIPTSLLDDSEMAKAWHLRELQQKHYRPKFCKLLQEAAKDEEKAKVEYGRLKRLATKSLPEMSSSGAPVVKRFKELVDEILDDEGKHKEKLSRYLTLYCS